MERRAHLAKDYGSCYLLGMVTLVDPMGALSAEAQTDQKPKRSEVKIILGSLMARFWKYVEFYPRDKACFFT
jgi:hypothetical protein